MRDRKNCEHNWVYRKDGWEEQCVPAICTICGEYGCFCDFMRTSMKYDKANIEEKKEIYDYFIKEGINGDNHYIENRMKEEGKEKSKFNRFEIMHI